MPVIKLRNSQTQSAAPSGLTQGEVAVNERDGILYYRDSVSNTSRALVWSGGAFTGFVGIPTGGPSPFKPSLYINGDTATGLGSQATSSLALYCGSGTTYQFTATQAQFPAVGSAAAPVITFAGDTNTGIAWIGADTLAIATGGATRVLVSSGGNVGINLTSTPEARLHVNGSFRVTGSITEGYLTVASSGTASTITMACTVQDYTLTGNCTFTMPAVSAGQSFTLLLRTGAGNFTASFTGVRWAGGIAPTVTTAAARMDLFTFVSDGTNWYGTVAQNYTP